MLTIIAVLLFLILLAIAAPQLLRKIVLLLAWPIDMALLIVRVPLWAASTTMGFFVRKGLPALQAIALWGLVVVLALDLGGHLTYWAIHGWPRIRLTSSYRFIPSS